MSDVRDDPVALGAKDEKRWWEYAALMAIGVLVLIGIYLLINHKDWIFGKGVAPTERAGSGSNQPFRGGLNGQAQKAAAGKPPNNQVRHRPPVDETADFKAPLSSHPDLLPPVQQTHTKAVGSGDADRSAQEGEGDDFFMATAVAERIPHPEWTINEGTVFSCTTTTAIDTSVGTADVGVTAMLPYEVRSMDNSNALLDKGTILAGHMAHGLVNGANRAAVVWYRATTPSGVRIRISSPATGPLGEAGMDVDVNRHTGPKIGAVVAMSLLQGGLAVAQARAQQEGTTNIGVGFQPITTGSSTGADLLLRSIFEMPDIAHRDHGMPCAVYMNKPLDFSKVYRDRVIHR